MTRVKRVTEAQKKRERIKLTKKTIERRIDEIFAWLTEHPSDHPEWSAKVREMHVLEIALDAIVTPFRRGETVGDDYRIITNC